VTSFKARHAWFVIVESQRRVWRSQQRRRFEHVPLAR